LSGGCQNSVGRVKSPNCATTPAWFCIIFTWIIQKSVRSIVLLLRFVWEPMVVLVLRGARGSIWMERGCIGIRTLLRISYGNAWLQCFRIRFKKDLSDR
jgi:hypothetical protein